MPELPEVETMRRGVLPIIGSQIVQVDLPKCRYKPIRITPPPSTFRRRAVGRRIVGVERIGKRLAVQLVGDATIVFEPRMTGLVLLSAPPDKAHLRFGLRLEGGQTNQLWYWDRRGLGSVRLFSAQQFHEEFGPARLGPDALQLTSAQLRAQLEKSRRAIKVALLDQRSLAGIGNLYASEILHLAGVHPDKRCDLISRETWRVIVLAMRRVLTEAIRYEGSTLADGTYRNALNQNGSYQDHHRVYNRQGQPCLTCGRGPIQRIVQAQRSTYFCAKCQTKRTPRRW